MRRSLLLPVLTNGGMGGNVLQLFRLSCKDRRDGLQGKGSTPAFHLPYPEQTEEYCEICFLLNPRGRSYLFREDTGRIPFPLGVPLLSCGARHELPVSCLGSFALYTGLDNSVHGDIHDGFLHRGYSAYQEEDT